MKKIIITLAALAAVSGSALAFEKSDSEVMGRKNKAVVTVEQAPLSSGASIWIDNNDRRGGSKSSY